MLKYVRHILGISIVLCAVFVLFSVHNEVYAYPQSLVNIVFAILSVFAIPVVRGKVVSGYVLLGLLIVGVSTLK
jgi:hypothetical protein